MEHFRGKKNQLSCLLIVYLINLQILEIDSFLQQKPVSQRLVGAVSKLERKTSLPLIFSEKPSNDTEKEREILKAANEIIKETGAEPIPEQKAVKKEESLTPVEYLFGKEGEFMNDMIRNGVSPRRLFLNTALAGAVAIGGNLFGVTSGLLSISPKVAADLKLDSIYPVGGFKRWVDKEDGYEFIYPQDWLQDQAVAFSQQTAGVKQLGPQPIEVTIAKRQQKPSLKPDVAFGPPGGDFKENVSVIKSSLMPGFSLKGTLGNPKDAAVKLLSTSIAPEGSGKEWTLLDAFEEERNGRLVYQFEYLIKTPRFFLHNIGVITTDTGEDLYTLIVLTPQEKWEQKRNQLMTVAQSFQLL